MIIKLEDRIKNEFHEIEDLHNLYCLTTNLLKEYGIENTADAFNTIRFHDPEDEETLEEALENIQSYIEDEVIFNINFWQEKVDWMNNGDMTGDQTIPVRFNGWHFLIGVRGTFTKGYGGKRHKIKFIDGPHKGLEIETDNLWCQGKITYFQDILKNNAVIESY